jgi:rhodanese-related sulfurtransferase
LIDLREENEIKKDGKILNSINIPFPKIENYLSQNEKEYKNKKILFYCAVGHRSALAVEISKSYNYINSFHLIGGLKNWKIKGMETS